VTGSASFCGAKSPFRCAGERDRRDRAIRARLGRSRRAEARSRRWDTHLLRGYDGRTRIADYADALDSHIKPDDANAWCEGTPEQWANESHVVAREHVYAGVPADGPPPKLDQKYVDDARPIVEQRQQRAGIRLTDVLNQALSGEVHTIGPHRPEEHGGPPTGRVRHALQPAAR
jgi:hypothetical protein